MSPETRPSSRAAIKGRFKRMRAFAEQAAKTDAGDETTNAPVVSSLVLAGIAAADVICSVALGEHSTGDDHQQAIKLLAKAVPGNKDLPTALKRLLDLKSKSQYWADPVSNADCTTAQRAAERLIAAAEDRYSQR